MKFFFELAIWFPADALEYRKCIRRIFLLYKKRGSGEDQEGFAGCFQFYGGDIRRRIGIVDFHEKKAVFEHTRRDETEGGRNSAAVRGQEPVAQLPFFTQFRRRSAAAVAADKMDAAQRLRLLR